MKTKRTCLELRLLYLQYIGKKALDVKPEKKTDDPPAKEELERLKKFKESLYKCGVQILFTLILIIVAVPKPWFRNTKLFWSDCTRLPCEAVPSIGERLVY